MATDICTDIETCTCYIESKPVNNGCQYVGCPGSEETISMKLVEATDGTVMHGHCWDEYGRMWDIGHPNMKAAMIDVGLMNAERQRGA